MSGYLENGQWREGWYDTGKTAGEFVRTTSQFRHCITADGAGGYLAEPGRYHLYVSLACPWAHRTLIARALKRLNEVISVSVVEPVMTQGWCFSEALPDHLHGFQFLHQVYSAAVPEYTGRVLVPVLWDKKTRTIVSNESSEILRMFNEAFAAFTSSDVDLYPADLRPKIDEVNEFVYGNVNNGVYRCGFATGQAAYERAFERLFSALDHLEADLGRTAWLAGEQPTEADWRLFTTLARFDAVYFGHFKCNRNRIEDMPNLSRFLRSLYRVPGIAATVNMDHIKRHYYMSHAHINPTRIVPVGPRLKFMDDAAPRSDQGSKPEMSRFELPPSLSSSSDCPPCPGRPVFDRIALKPAEIGPGFTVRRALPTRQRRMVGAWCFLDHIGPMSYGRGKGMNVGPHPHTALQTFTWVVEGELLHRDSLGYEQVIRRGQVNLMTAGRGAAHAEDAVNDEPGRAHVAQLWIALPDRERHREPSFHHYASVPVVETDGYTVTVLAGTAFGQTSPAAVFSPLVGVDFCCRGPARLEAPLEPSFEHAILVLEGSVMVDDESASPGELLYLGTGRASITLVSDRASRVLLIGGEPFGEHVLLWWNFAGRTTDELRQAVMDWNEGNGRFGEVRGSPSPRYVAPSLEGISLKESAR